MKERTPGIIVYKKKLMLILVNGAICKKIKQVDR